MEKQDWLDYFEAVNGRTPSPEEIATALANGEFIEEEVVTKSTPEVAPVADEPVFVQPTPQVQAAVQQEVPQQEFVQQQFTQPNQQFTQQQFAQPNQQFAQQNPNVQFNQAGQQTGPAMAFSQTQQGQQDVYNVQVAVPSAYSSFFKQFWTWLVSAWKTPSAQVETHKYNGYFAFFLLVLFSSLTIFIPTNQVVSGINGFVSGFTGQYSSGGVDFSVFFKILFALAFIFFSIIFAGFVVRRFVYKENFQTLTTSFDKYGRLFSVNILLFAVSALLMVLNVYSLAAILIGLSLFLLSAVSVFAIANFDNANTLDKFYQYLIAMFVNAVIIFIFIIIGMSIAGESLVNSMNFF